ncbi:MAG: hypothetical protein ACLRNQ_07290 [Flavonifractor plautii]
MDDIEAVFNRKDMTFEEAVQYFKERVPVTASVFYGIAEKYRGSPSQWAATRRRRSSSGSMRRSSRRWNRGTPLGVPAQYERVPRGRGL